MFSWFIQDTAVADASIMFRGIMLQNAGYGTYICVAAEYSPVLFLCSTEVASFNI